MQKEYKNKAIKSEPKKENFFFSGSTEYLPQNVRATSQEEAVKEWEKTRVAVNTKAGEKQTEPGQNETE